MSSWYDAWADRYGDWSTSFTAGDADVPFYVGLARDADGPLVELAVGTGRVAIPVAQATGRRVLGIDSSAAMLAQARENAVEEGVELDLREGDMRELEIEEPAALSYFPQLRALEPARASPAKSQSLIHACPLPEQPGSQRARCQPQARPVAR